MATSRSHQRALWRGTTLPRLLLHQAQATPRVVAHRCSGADLTYGAWADRAMATARGLLRRGVQPGDRVALRFTAAEWIDLSVAYLGVQMAGAVGVFLPHDSAPVEAAAMVDQAACTAALSGATASVPGMSRQDTVSACEANGRSTAVVDRSEPAGLAGIIFTSGTTDVPKAVAFSHANATFEAPIRMAAFPWSVAGSPCVHAHPPFGAGGHGRVVAPLLAPVPIVTMPRFDPGEFCELVRTSAASHVSLVPATATLLARWPRLASEDLRSVRVVSSGSAPLSPAAAESLGAAFTNAAIVNQYSLSEALPAKVRGCYQPARPDVVGKPSHGTVVSIRDPGSGADLPRGEVGEVWLSVRGAPPRLYFGDAIGSAEVFVDGFTRTGDLGYVDVRGRLAIVDRATGVINRGGLKVSAREVERALESHPIVVHAAVVGYPHPVLGEEVGAAMVVDGPYGTEVLRHHVRSYLASWKVPKRIVVLPALPRTGTGKVDTARIVELLLASAPSSASAPPVTHTERLLAHLWEQVLGRSVGRSDDFFAAGGDSLAAARIAERAHSAGIALDLVDIFDHPGIAELAATIDRRRSSL